MKDVLNPKDVMEILDIGRRQTYELLENPPFHTVRVGRLIKKIQRSHFLNGLMVSMSKLNNYLLLVFVVGNIELIT